MSATEEPENLSEILFKPRFEYTETSLISNSGAGTVPVSDVWKQECDFTDGWYRPLHLMRWVMAGGKLSDIDIALSNIVMCGEKRTRDDCADTVQAYGRGNWIYEFNALAQNRYLQAREEERAAAALEGAEKTARLQLAAHQYRMAARYFTIASYPRLKGDDLASEAYLHALRMYRSIFACAPELGTMQATELKTPAGPIGCFVHLPPGQEGTAPEPQPFAVFCGSYGNSLTDYLAVYRMFFMPRGLGMLVVDLPGTGASEKLSLNYDLSMVIEAALDYAQNCAALDSTRAALIGVRMGGTACLRCALLRPERVRAMGLIEPAVDHMFTNREFLRSFPLCFRSLYANRLGQNAADWENLIPQMQVFSLKKQGLLSAARSCQVPVMAFSPAGLFTSEADAELLNAGFKEFTLYEDPRGNGEFGKKPQFYMYRALSALVNFIADRLECKKPEERTKDPSAEATEAEL